MCFTNTISVVIQALNIFFASFQHSVSNGTFLYTEPEKKDNKSKTTEKAYRFLFVRIQCKILVRKSRKIAAH